MMSSVKFARFVLAAGLALAGAAGAAQTAAAGKLTMPAGEYAQGEVRKVDRENARVTLRHGEISSLDMPGMTMVFDVPDAKVLAGLTAGDKVRFRASSDNGKMTLLEIQPAN